MSAWPDLYLLLLLGVLPVYAAAILLVIALRVTVGPGWRVTLALVLVHVLLLIILLYGWRLAVGVEQAMDALEHALLTTP